MYIRFLYLNEFDQTLDHPDANVINCINERVNLNPRGGGRTDATITYYKYIFEYQLRSTLSMFFFEAVHTNESIKSEVL